MELERFIDGQLAELRVLVGLVAPRGAEQPGRWPVVWIRTDRGDWRELAFGRSHRARQLLALLALHPDGLNGPRASQFFDPDGEGSSPTDAHPVPSGVRDERAKSALRTVRRKLLENEIADASSILVVPAGHRGAEPWRLTHALTDVELARRAADAGHWGLAWDLLHGGDGQLVGLARQTRRPRRPPLVGLRPSAADGRMGVLPREIVIDARQLAQRVTEHYAGVGASPPPPPATFVEQLLAGERGRSATDARRATLPVLRPPSGIEPVGEGDGVWWPVASAAAVRPAPSRWQGRLAGFGLGALTTAVVGFGVFSLFGGLGQASSSTRSFRTSAQTAPFGRIEVQTYVSDANTFENPRVLDAPILHIPGGSTILVACRRHVPGPSSLAPFWWYEVLTPPWRGRWVPANSFLNGDPAADYLGPHPHPPHHQHAVDTSVSICGEGEPNGSLETPVRAPVHTFADPSTGSGSGPAIEGAVTVSCKVFSTTAASEPGGYAYRVASAPWDGRYYAPARAFRNAIPADSDVAELVDPEVPTCPNDGSP